MKKIKYIGVFHYEGYQKEKLSFQLEVYALGFIQAFILLTAKAITEGKCYQLSWITDDKGGKREIGDLGILGNELIK